MIITKRCRGCRTITYIAYREFFEKNPYKGNIEMSCTPCTINSIDGGAMREKQVEQKLVQAVKARGGICPKFVSPGFSVYVLDGPEKIGGILDEIQAT